MKTLNFKTIIRLIDFDIASGNSKISIFCPDYHINQFNILSYMSYLHLNDICNNHKYGRRITSNQIIIDRCFVSDIINGKF